MSATDPANSAPANFVDLLDPTILAAFDVATLAYDVYTDQGDLVTKGTTNVDPIEAALNAAHWTQIKDAPGQQVPGTTYQGDAFYKNIGGTIEVIIGNRGSQKPHDFVVSDAQLAVGIIPASDTAADTYYGNIIDLLQQQFPTQTINAIETGHSLGGQEADYVDVIESNQPRTGVTPEAVGFDAPGVARKIVQTGVVYDALDISLSTDLVHVGGSFFNAGFAGAAVTVKAGTPLEPYIALGLVATLAPGGVALALASIGTGGTLFNGFYRNHISAPMRSYLNTFPALGGFDLLTNQPNEVTQGVVDALAQVSASAYAKLNQQSRADLYTTLLQGITPGASTGSADTEAFTVSSSDSGVTLVGSLGDEVVLASGTNTEELDGSGFSEVLTFNSAGTELLSDSWTSNDGISGSDSFSKDGSSSGRINFVGGGYAIVINDGNGNITRDYYNQNNDLYADSWIHSDGTSGTQSLVQNGLTRIPGETTAFDTPISGVSEIVSSNGSYSISTADQNDNVVTTTYDKTGAVLSTTSEQGEGQNFPDSGLTVTTSGGTEEARDASNDLVWTQTTDSATGDIHKTTYNASGDSQESVTHDGKVVDTYWHQGSGNYTHDHYNSDGLLVSDDWSLAGGGTSGTDTFDTSGSGSGTMTHSDGSLSLVTISSSGAITIRNENLAGATTSEDYWNPDKTYGVKMYNSASGNLLLQYAYQLNGTVIITNYAADGATTLSTQTVAAGAVMSPDGSQFGMIGADGVAYTNSNGESAVYKFVGSQIQATDYVNTEQESDFSVTLPSGEDSTSPYNSYTLVYTDANGENRTDYLSGGRLVGDDWTKSDGSHGSDTFDVDHSASGSVYALDNSYSTYDKDGTGDLSQTYYDTSGNDVGDSWTDVDGSHGYDQYNADGSELGSAYAADGSYSVYGDDTLGNSTQLNYSSAGVKVSDAWYYANGSFGTDQFNADGSKTGTSQDASGNYATFAVNSAASDTTTNYYLASGQFVEQTRQFTGANGASLTYTLDSSGNLLSTALTTAAGQTFSVSAPGGVAYQQTNIVQVDDSAISVAATLGEILAIWGDNDSVTSGGGSTIVDLGGSSDSVTGGNGSDWLEAFGTNDTLIGGLGAETFEINDSSTVVHAQAGAVSNALFTSVNYTLPTNVDAMTLIGNGDLLVFGNNDTTNVITGNSGNDTIFAGNGHDTLISGSGIDTLVGRSGIATFEINNSDDSISLLGYGGQDTVESSVSYTLQAQVGTLILTGSDDLSATDAYGFATLVGNAGNDTLEGGSGSDTLIAGSGVDTLISGTGSNTLVINNASDVIEVSPDAASVTVQSSVSYTLAEGIDALVLTDSGLVGQGNDDENNILTATSAGDTLIAGSGDDTLIAQGAGDTLIAGAGDDVLQGDAGSTYVLNAGFGTAEIQMPSDSGTLKFGTGISAADLSVSVISNAGAVQLQLSDGDSVVTLDDSGAFGFPSASNLKFDFANGSELTFAQLLATAQVQDTTVAGYSGNLVLNGDAGASIVGGTGNDTLIGTGAGDTIIAGSGNQVIYGEGGGDMLVAGNGSDTLYGGGDDTLVAGSGNSILNGGTGSNTYILNEGGTATLNPSSVHPGVETILLPQGMSLSDFTSLSAPDGNLVLQSLSGDTTAIVSAYQADSSNVWVIADQSGNAEFLNDWVATSGSPGGGGGSPGTYEAKIAALLQEYQSGLSGTLNQIGLTGQSLANPYLPGGNGAPTNYTFTGVSTSSVSVQDGLLHVGSSDSWSYQTLTPTNGTITRTYEVPIYETVTSPTTFWSVSATNPALGQLAQIAQNGTVPLDEEQVGNSIQISGPSRTATVQVGTQTVTETIPTQFSQTASTQGLTAYNIVGDGGSDVITADANFAGTVVTGDGNSVNVDLGFFQTHGYGQTNYEYPGLIPPGAFIEVGNGVNDTITGTGSADVIAAGLGFDSILAATGSTVYVPMEGASTDIIDIAHPFFYGDGPFPHNTLVLPDGITPQDLQYKLIEDSTGDSYIQLTHGDSTVLMSFDPNPPPNTPLFHNGTPDDTAGINYFQFSDGTVLTRTQVLAMAGSPVEDSGAGATVTQGAESVTAGSAVSGADLFSSTDARIYQVSNTATSGAYFTLNGTAYSPGQTFDVAANQLAQLQYVPGASGSSDSLTVTGFNGVAFGNALTFSLPVGTSTPPNNFYQATGANQTVQGDSSGPDTLAGGYAGDTLVGASGQDTFQYNVGGAAETLSETAAVTSSSANVLQFGEGISPSDLSLGIASDGDLVATVGAIGDSITLEGFDPVHPLISMPIQQFAFADGTSLSFVQLLSEVSYNQQNVVNVDGSSAEYSFNIPDGRAYVADVLDANSQLINEVTLFTDGSAVSVTNTYHSDGSETQDSLQTTADGEATDYLVQYNAQGNESSLFKTNPDGSTDSINYDSQARIATEDQIFADGSQQSDTYTYNSDGTWTQDSLQTAAGGGATDYLSQYNAQGVETSVLKTFPDGSTDLINYDSQSRIAAEDQVFADGSEQSDTYTYNSDGSWAQDSLQTAAGGGATDYLSQYNAQGVETSLLRTNPDGSTNAITYDSQQRVLTEATTSLDGSGESDTYTYNNDGSSTLDVVQTPSGGGAPTDILMQFNAQGAETSMLRTDPDGSTDAIIYDSQSRIVTEDQAFADGSAQNATNTYNSDGTTTENLIETPAGGGAPTTVVYNFDSQGLEINALQTDPDGAIHYTTYDSNEVAVNANTYRPSTDGSYSDEWGKSDGTAGNYWWNSSTLEYQQVWDNSDGSNWTDTYQYASGGTPGASGVSFTETYTDSAGDQGTRQYDAATGVTNLSWTSDATGMLTGTTTDSGFIGLVNQGEITNTQQDPSFFNPTLSPAFESFLAGH